MRRKAKIAATLGPAVDDDKTLGAMLASGVDVARLNFSHGEPEDHARRVAMLRKAERSLGRTFALMADLQGPRFRIGRLPGGSLELVAGEEAILVAGRKRSRPGTLPVSYAALARDVSKGNRILIDDGKVELQVKRVRGESVHCTVLRGGPVADRKGINLPETVLSTPSLTVKDRRDLRQAVALGADWLAVSFVRQGDDIRRARRLLQRAGREIPLMAKIELPQAIDRLEDIIQASDGILVARGDLGVELPPERVPVLQKQIIEAANAAGKPVMTATQMLDSMRYSLRPTRAEASDVANAVLDGSDCLLLTAETAAGKYPIEAVRMMGRIIENAESSGRAPRRPFPDERLSVALSACLAGCRSAFEVGARRIAVFTQSGFSALQVARFRPRTTILALSPSLDVARQLNLVWGVNPDPTPACDSFEEMIAALDHELLKRKRVRKGEVVVVLSGAPIGEPGTTNLVLIHRVGKRYGS